MITHEHEVAERAKRVISLADGRIVEDRRVVGVHEPPPPHHDHASALGLLDGASR